MDRPVLLFPVVNDGFNTIEQRAEYYKDYFQVTEPKAMGKGKMALRGNKNGEKREKRGKLRN